MRLKRTVGFIKASFSMEHIIRMSVKVGRNWYLLERVDIKDFSKIPRRIYGVPVYFSIEGKLIHIAPRPNKNYYAELVYTEIKRK